MTYLGVLTNTVSHPQPLCFNPFQKPEDFPTSDTASHRHSISSEQIQPHMLLVPGHCITPDLAADTSQDQSTAYVPAVIL